MSSNLLTVKEVAERLRLSEYTVRKHSENDIIPCIRIGGAVRFEADAIDDFCKSGGKGLSKTDKEK